MEGQIDKLDTILPKKRIIIVLVGNDGTGKSTITNMINDHTHNDYEITCVERSGKYKDSFTQFGLDPSAIDKATLFNSFEEEYDSFKILDEIKLEGNNISVFWIMLDADVDLILKRIEKRSVRDVWEKEKTLKYFKRKFTEISGYHGIPLIDTTNMTLEEVCEEIINLCTKEQMTYYEVRDMALKNMTHQKVQKYDIENILMGHLRSTNFFKGEHFSEYFSDIDDFPKQKFYKSTYDNFMSETDKAKIYVRWLISGTVVKSPGMITITKNNRRIELLIESPLLILKAEGESKKLYNFISVNPYLLKYAIIVLKSTIYSHSMQATGEINGLSKVRATGTKLFLEMMYRNDLQHTYQCINNNGIILSKYLKDVPMTEIVVKKYLEGTDKHSFHNLRKTEAILETGEYRCGPYVRFDWRNPNHIDKIDGESVSSNRYYYLFEECLGKEKFHLMYLTKSNNADIVPFGDKNITEDIVTSLIDTSETKKTVLKMFLTIQHYFNKIGLEIKDVCFMLDSTGKIFWSEINQDCMRIKTLDNSDQFDKDIWRAGGSSSKDMILKKWTEFNTVLSKYFRDNKFHLKEMFDYNTYPVELEIKKLLSDTRYKIPSSTISLLKSVSPKKRRRVIVTIDIFDGKPVLVKSGKVYTTHSEGSYETAIKKLSVFPDILVVDLNGALSEGENNRKIINELAKQYYIHTGGGLRSLADVQNVLQNSVRRVVIGSSNFAEGDELIKVIPKDRLIVELSLNEKNEILSHGRKVNTYVNIFERMKQLADYGVEAISITFHQTEGHMRGIPREQIWEIMTFMPASIKKVIIAGGISTMDDLEYLWSFDSVIPQLGSAIWTNTLSIGQIYVAMCNFDSENKVHAIIQDTNGRVKGDVYMNPESIMKTLDTYDENGERKLYRYSRESKSVMRKGDTSGDYQIVQQISLDCDSDSLLITVDSEKPFCHTKNYSCFSLQTVNKTSISTLTEHIKSRMNSDSYSGFMQKNPALPLAKLMEEFWEIVTAYKDTQVEECSDLLVHMLMYLNGIGVSIEDVLNELNARRWNPRLLSENNGMKNKDEKDKNNIIICVTAAKYSDKTDDYLINELGIKIIRHDGRSLKVDNEIVDKEKYFRYFGDKTVSIVTARPKDMLWLLFAKRVDYAVTYETVVKNFPKVYKTIHEVVDPKISLALIKRRGENIDIASWSKSNKALIAAEHVCHVAEHFHKMGVPQNAYHLDRITGSSEGFLINTNQKYLLCDAVVESGKTIEDNDLEIWETIIPKGEVRMGLYSNLFI